MPGLLADSLPDRFGNALIDAWLATAGRTPESFSPIERLCYTGARGMGALEFAPACGPKPRKATRIDIDALVTLASDILTERRNLKLEELHYEVRTPLRGKTDRLSARILKLELDNATAVEWEEKKEKK